MASKESIAVIAPCPFFIDRGTPIRIKRLATMMGDSFDVHVISFHQGRDIPAPFKIHRTIPLPLKIKRSGANMAKLFYDFFLIFKVLSVVKKNKIKLIDGHLHEGAFIGLIAKLFFKIPVIYNAHGTFVKELLATGALKEKSFLLKLLSLFEDWVERKVDALVAQSIMRQEEFIAKGHSPEKVTIIEDVPELDDLYLSDDQIDRKLEADLRPNGEQLLIYSGGMETYQGVDFLMDAFNRLCKKRKDVRLVLFGRPMEEYRKIAEKMGISDRIVFVDYEPFERLPQYLKICDIGFALRLYGENVPGKLPIYMASGIASIGTDTKGINTVITDNENGMLVPPGDVNVLVEKIEFLLNDAGKTYELGMNGREEALRRYSPDKAKKDLSKLYIDLINKYKAGKM